MLDQLGFYLHIMDRPDWFPIDSACHSDKLLAIAQFVYDTLYHEEIHLNKGPMMTFDNMCSGNLQRAAHVLSVAGYTEFIDDLSRRSVFVVEPDAFKTLAQMEQARRIAPELLLETANSLQNDGSPQEFGLKQFMEMLYS